ncbi:hypothetical protein NR798_39770 [Archangium gephyra]|uniref:hypothetical protein n=1 Tax=Archangium gephyra TaxID=48 RepID=UPI0035D4DBAB
MNWVMTLAMFLQREPLSLDDLSTALFVRGRYAVETRGELAEDARLRLLEREFLLKAALQPELDILVLRLEQAEAALEDVDDELALQAERALADVLNDRDCWQVRAVGLRALHLESVAGAVEAELARFDERLRSHARSLGAIAWMRDEALASAWNAADTAWSLVPPAEDTEPRRHSEVHGPPALKNEQLLRVSQGLADPTLERRVLRELEEDEELRKHYEELLEDFEVFQEAPRNVVHLFVHKHVPNVTVAKRLPTRAVAATTSSLRYETPGIDALIYTFQDSSELYVQRDGPRWVLFLSREHPGAHDGFQGPVVESIQHGQVLIAVSEPGEVQVRYGDARVQLTLEQLQT